MTVSPAMMVEEGEEVRVMVADSGGRCILTDVCFITRDVIIKVNSAYYCVIELEISLYRREICMPFSNGTCIHFYAHQYVSCAVSAITICVPFYNYTDPTANEGQLPKKHGRQHWDVSEAQEIYITL